MNGSALILRGHNGFALKSLTPLGFAMLRDASRVGVIGLSRTHCGMFVGCDVEEPYRGNGYATQALRLVSAWAFAELKLDALWARVSQDNEASQKVLGRAGFHVEHVESRYYLCTLANRASP